MSDVERTALVGRVVDLVRDRGPVAVVGHPCPWRDDLVAVLAERLDHPVAAYDAVPGDVAAIVWLELSAGEARFQQLRHEGERSGRRARGEPLVPGGAWFAHRPGQVDDVEEPLVAPAGVDVAFVPVSGVRAPRRLRVSWGDPADGLWDEGGNRGSDELADLLHLPDDVRQAIAAAVDASGAEPRDLRGRIRAVVGADVDVTG